MLLKILRIVLFPFSILYGVVVTVRNYAFDKGWLPSTAFDIPVICVGNLSVGGTGKTPQIEYLIRLLQDKYKLATLSRGYKRKSKGFVLANANTKMEAIGDEPFQYHRKFEDLTVAVDEKRVNGVTQILKKQPDTQIVLLDDAFQHRKIKAGYHILLTSYDHLFYDDFMMPTGNLREPTWCKNRADVVVVTKCPLDLSKKKQEQIQNKIQFKKFHHVFFTGIKYAKQLRGEAVVDLETMIDEPVLLITGIAKPKPFVTYLKKNGLRIDHLSFKDHHDFSNEDLSEIEYKANGKPIITTEKDYVRLQNKLSNLYYLPIETSFLDNGSEMFDEKVFKFIHNF